jgi:hypothetical protein
MTRYVVRIRVSPVAGCRPLNRKDALTARCIVTAAGAPQAACQVAAPYLDSGLVVDWNVRRAGIRGLGQRCSGRFVPGDDNGTAGVREPRRPYPPAGSASAALDPPAA